MSLVIFNLAIASATINVNGVGQPGATILMPPFSSTFSSGDLGGGGTLSGGSQLEVDTTGVTGLPSPFFAVIDSSSTWTKTINANQTVHYNLSISSSGPQGTFNFLLQTTDQAAGSSWSGGPSALATFNGTITVAGSGDADDIFGVTGTLSTTLIDFADMDVAQQEEYQWGGGDRY